MLPNEIVEILEKNQYRDNDIIEKINTNISDIIENLYLFNQNLAEQIKNLIIDKKTDNNVSEIVNDSIILRNYIESIKLLKTQEIDSKCLSTELAKEITPIQDIQPKPVKLYLCDDNVCPACNFSMDETYTAYTENFGISLKTRTIDTYKCGCCNRFFVCDYIVKNIKLKNTNLIINRKYYNKIPSIDIGSVIVLKTTLKCSSHRTEELLAQIPVLKKDGDVFYHSLDALYCFECNQFSILEDDFNVIKDIILCKVIDETYINSQSISKNNFQLEQDVSVLKYYGYNVQTKKNISEQQRHIILSSLIEAGIMNRREVINHIHTLIQRGSKIESWNNATQKWKDDIEFVKSYKTEELPKVVFDKIVLKYKKHI